MNRSFFLLGWGLCLTAGGLGAQEASELEVLFVQRVWPTLQEKCLACHGADPDDLRGELDLSRRDGLVVGGESEGPAWQKATPLESPLLRAVRWDGLEMPPKENDRLSEDQIEAFETWLVGGAVWPDSDRIEAIRKQFPGGDSNRVGRVVRTSGGLSEAWTQRRYREEDLWAYRPLSVQSHPASEPADRNPIDDWVARGLEKYGLERASEADRRTLIRRATYDLTGLPPTTNEIEAFLSDPASTEDAFRALVDRLLDSPHYGEHWGRHWLDVVRYADSSTMNVVTRGVTGITSYAVSTKIVPTIKWSWSKLRVMNSIRATLRCWWRLAFCGWGRGNSRVWKWPKSLGRDF